MQDVGCQLSKLFPRNFSPVIFLPQFFYNSSIYADFTTIVNLLLDVDLIDICRSVIILTTSIMNLTWTDIILRIQSPPSILSKTS